MSRVCKEKSYVWPLAKSYSQFTIPTLIYTVLSLLNRQVKHFQEYKIERNSSCINSYNYSEQKGAIIDIILGNLSIDDESDDDDVPYIRERLGRRFRFRRENWKLSSRVLLIDDDIFTHDKSGYVLSAPLQHPKPSLRFSTFVLKLGWWMALSCWATDFHDCPLLGVLALNL